MRKQVLLLSACLAAAQLLGFSTDQPAFFKGPGPDEVKLPANQIFPQGRIFPFSFYSCGGTSAPKEGETALADFKEQDQKLLAENGVSMFGPQYELNGVLADDMKKYGTRGVYSLHALIDGEKVTLKYLGELRKEKKELDLKQVYDSIAGQVKAAADNAAIAWWDVTPEELRFWYKNEMQLLETMCKAVRESDPLKRPVFMYEPGHRSAISLSKTLAQGQDLVCKGVYTGYSSMRDKRHFVRWSIEQGLEATKLAGRDVPVILLPEMFYNVEEADVAKIPAWVRHDVFAGLTAGAKGVMVFSARRRPKFTQWEQWMQEYLRYSRMLAGDLGQVFLFGERRDDITVDLITGPEKVPFSMASAKVETEFSALDVANLAWNGSRYLFIVNSSNEPVTAMVSGLVYGKEVTVGDLLDGEKPFTAPEGNFEIALPPLGVKAYRIYSAKQP